MRIGFREIIFLTLMAACLAASFMFFKKTDTTRVKLLSDIREDETALNNLRTATVGIADMGKKLDELQQAITFFESKLPQEKEMDKVLEEVTQRAEANSLTKKTFKTLKQERSSSYSEQPIQLTLEGDFNGFYAFLLQLERLPRLIRVTDMNLQKISDRDGEMTAQMTMIIFFEPDTNAQALAN